MGGLLDSKGYGIATRKGTPYKALLDNAILKLLEGTLHKLKVMFGSRKEVAELVMLKGVEEASTHWAWQMWPEYSL